jgi:hypothetical protein
MSAKTAALPTEVHHARPAPEEHLCTCGRLREDCVRSTVRALWSRNQGRQI